MGTFFQTDSERRKVQAARHETFWPVFRPVTGNMSYMLRVQLGTLVLNGEREDGLLLSHRSHQFSSMASFKTLLLPVEPQVYLQLNVPALRLRTRQGHTLPVTEPRCHTHLSAFLSLEGQ